MAETVIISARFSKPYQEVVDAFADSIGMKRGKLITEAIGLYMALKGKTAVTKSVKPTKANILAALAELGPSTCPEIRKHLGCDREVSRYMNDLRRLGHAYTKGKRESEDVKGRMLDIWHIKEVER